MAVKSKKIISLIKKNCIKGIAPSVIIAIVGIFISIKANTISTTQNMFEINNAIQLRTDVVLAVEYETEEFYNEKIIDDSRSSLLAKKSNEAVRSMLNTYEFACTLYLRNMVDKEIFKQYYYGLIRTYMVRYDSLILPNQLEPYSAIKTVDKEWRSK
jgi:hypothetical protein